MPDRCETCQHWSPCAHTADYGACLLLTKAISEVGKPDRNTANVDPTDDAIFLCGAEFGCVKHSPAATQPTEATSHAN